MQTMTARPAVRIRLGVLPRPRPAFALHLARAARDRLDLESEAFGFEKGVVFADLRAARRFAERLNRVLATRSAPISPGQLFALGLIHELLHATLESHRDRRDPRLWRAALEHLASRLGGDRLERTLVAFIDAFPPPEVYEGELSAAEYLAGETAGVPHLEVALEELLLLWLGRENPAFEPFDPLFDDSELRESSDYTEVARELEDFVAERAVGGAAALLGESGPSLVEVLRAPAVEAPESLSGQLEMLSVRAPQLPAPEATPLFERALRGTDVLREEERPIFPPGPGPIEPPRIEPEMALGPARYSEDRAWMPHLVLIAKNTLVWLDQLSRRHGRTIERLDEIPDSELDQLADWGVTGLWLIGLWHRSPASAAIKKATGNPEAAPSAYSITEYTVAEELGGEEALEDLVRRAGERGIRLAADMVPNHMGLDSRWVLEHPERFLSLDHPPYPGYTFDGPDLSPDPAIEIRLEDHYYDRTDASVVFERRDVETGKAAYLYHGNDGTSTPWNDTAQLDYLSAEAREAVIETILEIARRFPIIRFDAAMTLARRHIRRLWHPQPGTGGAIPSRSEHALSEAAFDAACPEEFWREVVDRVAEEAPDTLLLAEAFWLMESYFVRELGMHRVYNSAFMHMLRDERNGEYRKALAEILAADPEILGRYVNYLSNPDERTAADQFGGGDKYFGAAVLAATLPGLPLIAHGQIEGLVEKYGMEYRKAYRDEVASTWLIQRHERQIFPLLRRRRLFAGAANFRLFDFEIPPGRASDDVFAFSNREGDERALVVFHNRGAITRGRIRSALPVAGGSDEKARGGVAEILGIELSGPPLVACRDLVQGTEHLLIARDLVRRGLELELGPYRCHVFADFRGREDDPQGRLMALARALAGRGVPSLDESLREPELAAVLAPFRELIQPELVERAAGAIPLAGEEWDESVTDEIVARFTRAARALTVHFEEVSPEEPADEDDVEDETSSTESAQEQAPKDLAPAPLPEPLTSMGDGEEAETAGGATETADRVRRLAAFLGQLLAARGAEAPAEAEPPAEEEEGEELEPSETREADPPELDPATEPSSNEPESPPPESAEASPPEDPAAPRLPDPDSVADYLAGAISSEPSVWAPLLVWSFVAELGRAGDGEEPNETLRAWLDELLLGRQMERTFGRLGLDERAARAARTACQLLITRRLAPAPEGGEDELAAWLNDVDVRRFLGVHVFEGTTWISGEALSRLLWMSVLTHALEDGLDSASARAALARARSLEGRAAAAGFRLDVLLDEIEDSSLGG